MKDVKPIDKHFNIRRLVKKINAISDFTRNDGSKGVVGSFLLSDSTGSIRVVLWNEKTFFLSFIIKISKHEITHPNLMNMMEETRD